MADVVRRSEEVVRLIRLRAGRETDGVLEESSSLVGGLLVGILAEVDGLSLVGALVGALVGVLVGRLSSVGALLGMSLVGLLRMMSLVGALGMEMVVPGLVAGARILAPLGARRALSIAFLLFSMEVTSLPVRVIESLLGPTMQRSRFPVEQYRESPLSELAMEQSRTL